MSRQRFLAFSYLPVPEIRTNSAGVGRDPMYSGVRIMCDIRHCRWSELYLIVFGAMPGNVPATGAMYPRCKGQHSTQTMDKAHAKKCQYSSGYVSQ